MRRSCVVAVVIAAVGIGSALEVAAQQRKPEDNIKMRQAAFTVMSWNFGVLAAMAKGQRPYDQAEAVKRAETVALASHLPFEGFPKGSESGLDTRALPEVWSDPDKFKSNQERLQSETAKLVQAAKSGDPGQLKSQVGATAKACSNCHDDFRRKK
ncbi:MAG: cytochrome c [Betaproteobacteria bacterium]|nr:cytochrome c [Betaproteobacteria bacterium]